MYRDQQKKIAAINDFCGFGRCSLAVSIPIISAMGLQCCPLPTAVFSNHTGYDSFYYTDFTSHMDAYMEQWERLELHFDGILTGFLGSPEQIDFVCRFMERFKKENTLVVIDPVMGDDGALYPTYSPKLAENMARLLQYADILTPNLTEACILTGFPYDPCMEQEELLKLCQALHALGPEKIVISGLERGEDLENFIYEVGKPPLVIREHKTGPCRAGTGDVFASILMADGVQGVGLAESVRRASAFIAKALRRTMELQLPEPDGICFEEFLWELSKHSKFPSGGETE
ncbi:MAG: pyridoxamine kinase [Oscillospiraceae bacterium]|nr:pyridoxamine kinase [Oscillospiraceae bacterium]